MAQQRNRVQGKKGQNKHGFVERFFRVTPTRNAAFISKLFTMVDDETTKDLITWTGSGDQFTVFNNTEFSRRVLPHYFKHCNWSSFVRQLNMYDFHKINDSNNDGETTSPVEAQQRWDFKHPWFNKAGFDRLHKIRRKPPRNRLIPQIRYSSAMEILPSSSPDYEVGETFAVGGSSSSESFNSQNHPPRIAPAGSSNQHAPPSFNDTLSHLRNNAAILESKMEATSNEVQFLRRITESQQEVLNELLATVEYLRSKLDPSDINPEVTTRKPKKIHELLGSENDHHDMEYIRFHHMQPGSHSPPIINQSYHHNNNSDRGFDMEGVIIQPHGSASGGGGGDGKSKKKYGADK